MIKYVVVSLLIITLENLPVFSMEIQVQGNEVAMSGHVNGSECSDLRTILQNNSVNLVVLGNSTGGDADAGYCVGALIRQQGLATVIRGSCASSCSRMWLGGVSRTLDGPNSRVGLHGNYDREGTLLPAAPARLRAWLPSYAPVDRQLMEQWINLGRNTQMMYFYNQRAELCDHQSCTPIPGQNAFNVGLSTR
jgi:hypothetical protein